MVQKLIFDFLMFDFGPRPRTFEENVAFEGFRLRFDDQKFLQPSLRKSVLLMFLFCTILGYIYTKS